MRDRIAFATVFGCTGFMLLALACAGSAPLLVGFLDTWDAVSADMMAVDAEHNEKRPTRR